MRAWVNHLTSLNFSFLIQQELDFKKYFSYISVLKLNYKCIFFLYTQKKETLSSPTFYLEK